MLPDKVRFKGCLYCYGCDVCDKKECKLIGNYDIDGWRYGQVDGWKSPNIGGTPNNVIVNKTLILHLYQCDFYTYHLPEHPVQVIL